MPNLINENSDIDWEYNTNIIDIGYNLPKNDLIQLSLVCKRYRQILEPLLFSSLKLFKSSISVEGIGCGEKRRRYLLMETCNQLKNTFGGKLKLVKNLEFYQAYNNAFAKKFLKLFTNIKSLKISLNHDEIGFVALGNSLKYSDKLINLEYCHSLPYKLEFNKVLSDRNKFNVIDNLRGLERAYSWPFCYLYAMNSSDILAKYLTKLTVISTLMLNDINFKFPILTELVFYSFDFDPILATQVIVKNRQLKSITLPAFTMNQGLADSIFGLKNLEYLRIDSLKDDSMENYTYLLENESIKRLVFNYKCFNQAVFPLLFHCKCLETLELIPLIPSRDPSIHADSIDWNTLEIQIPKLYLNGISNTNFPLYDFINSGIFNEFKFNCYWITLDHIEKNYRNLLDSGEWKFIDNINGNDKQKFSLVKVQSTQDI